MDNRAVIKQKLQEFARKFYLNKLYKGAILFIISTLLTFIAYTVLEYFSYFNTTVRTILFYSYLLIFAFTFVFYILIPLLKIGGFGKQISKEKIAQLIGEHFPEISDKLLNVIQLEQMLEAGDFKSLDILSAAIEVKIEKIKPFPFIKAIPFKKSTKFLKWAALPVLLFVVIFSVKSEIFTDSATRIIHHQQFYERPAPYNFEILNPKLTTFQNEPFVLKVKVIGDEVPSELFIAYGKRNYKLQKLATSEFQYTFNNLQQSVDFQLVTDEVTSKPFTLTVLPKPVTISFQMQLQYPAYLNKNTEIVENNGNATVPEGTLISWTFYTKNSENVQFFYADKVAELAAGSDLCSFSLRARTPFDYAIVNRNAHYTSKDTLKHTISVVPDQYPEIFVDSQQDSLFADRIYFKGSIRDDYGFSSVQFVYSKFDADGNLLEENQRVDIQIDRQNTVQDFYYYFDAGTLRLEAGYKLDYHFEVRDNDGVNGHKMSRTANLSFQLKTLEEIENQIDNSNSETKETLQELMKESSQLMKDIEKLNQDVMQNQTPSWQDKKKLEAMMERYNELKKQINALKDQQNEQKMVENQYKDLSAEILKKQEELEKRFDEILSDDLKEMLEKMQAMMQELNKDKMQETMEKMKLSAEEMNKNLDEQLQLFKQLEFEKKYTDIIEKTKNLAEEERQLSKQTQKNEFGKEELLKKQQQIEQKYQKLQQEMQDLKKLNAELEEPNEMKDHSELQQQIEQEMQSGREQLQKNNRKKASEKQQSAGEKMDELANQMEIDKLESEEEDLEEDIATLRQILDNLVRISFDQEATMVKTKQLNSRSTLMSEVLKEQFAVQDNMKLIDDSLSALARRQTAVKPFIQKEVGKINQYLRSAKQDLNDRRLPQSAGNQQFALTSMNNLALMLAESMKEMKQRQKQAQQQCNKCKSKGKSSSSCNNPNGQKKSKAKSARELQQQLNRQMEALKKSMQEGGKQQGQQSSGQPTMSEQFARMAAQQEAIRRMLQEYQNELKAQNGVGNKTLDQLMQEMERTERELVNKTISQTTLNRQKIIETRLLESERAEQKREKEEKREATEAREIRNPNPPKAWNIDKNREQQTEMLKTVPPNLNYYYKEKVNQYFYNIE